VQRILKRSRAQEETKSDSIKLGNTKAVKMNISVKNQSRNSHTKGYKI